MLINEQLCCRIRGLKQQLLEKRNAQAKIKKKWNTFPFKEKQTKWWKDIYAGLKLFFSSCSETPAMPGSKILSMCVFYDFFIAYILLFAVIDTLAIVAG